MATLTLNNGAYFDLTTVNSGTGNYDTFLRVQAKGSEEGFNTDENGNVLDNKAAFTDSLKFSSLQKVNIDGTFYYQIRLDLNDGDDKKDGGNPSITLESLKLYFSDEPATSDLYDQNLPGFTQIFSMANPLLLTADNGSGHDDGGFFIPASLFGGVGADDYITLYAKFTNSDGGFEEFRALTQPDAPDPDPGNDITQYSIEKTFVSVTGGNGNGLADHAGDVINYQVTIENTGTVALTGLALSDKVEGYDPTQLTLSSGDTDNDGVLDTDETWVYDYSYTLTQADLDADGYSNKDGKLDNTATATTTELTDPQTSSASVDLVYDPKLAIEKKFTSVTGGNLNDKADRAGDVINYHVTIENTGNVSLTGVALSDLLEGQATPVGLPSGDTTNPGVLDVGETWSYDYSYTLTQADLDARGYSDNDGKLNNTATVDTSETDPQSSSASVDLIYDPKLAIEKKVTSVTGGNGNDKADRAGDVINYHLVIENTGNVSLTGVALSDLVEGQATPVGLPAGDTTNPGVLDVGETWIYDYSYTLTQADLDARGYNNNDGKLNNTATADTSQTDPLSSSAQVDLVFDPKIEIEKQVSVDGGATWSDADLPSGPFALPTSDIQFKFIVKNTGNITLTGVTLSDNKLDLDPGSGTTHSLDPIAPGQQAVWVFGDDLDEVVTFVIGQHTNTGTATAQAGGTTIFATDDANYWGVLGEGLSHGYWKNHGPDDGDRNDWDISAQAASSFETFFQLGTPNNINWQIGPMGKKGSVASDITFEQALGLTGGGAQALAREAVAAILNIRDEDIQYGYTEAQVITMVKGAFASGNFDTVKNLLENENTSGNWM
ncbi:DUF11 domain-containing protein [Novosphingobium sp. JCM 18896]|uniref:DUF11 domain-containing protein n=1 Tax=Novosphingobium sp. JCM 18896 TaxID=2989731 RepID=UPI00222164CB|nr:DUF11 domain-containing protein [Novosphingobium sp. JCM 18896]MCW1427789.1 DUF11 domain-containing protein [Novosphingobium sp. JCM 18896]